MKIRSTFALLLTTVAVLFAMVSIATGQAGGYQPTDKENAGVGLAADFAVKEQSTTSKTTITLGTILMAEDGDAKLGARNLRLCLSVTAAGKPLVAQAIVKVDQYSNHKLTLWAKSTCGEAAAVGTTSPMGGFKGDGDYKPVADFNNDAGVGLAADFAVKEREANTKRKIAPATVVQAEDLEPKLGARNFRLCLTRNVKGKPFSSQALVTMDQYSNLKLLSWTDMRCGGIASATFGDEFKPINDPDEDGFIVMAANFAVKEQSAKTKSNITVAQVRKAEDGLAMLGARNLRLCLKLNGGGKSPLAQTVVTMDQYSNLKLVSWIDGCEGSSPEADGDGFKPVEKEFTAGVDLAADWAVEKHAKDTGKAHKLVEILKREEKGMFSMTYRICMKVGEEGKTETIQAIVSRDQYSNHKLVSWEHSKCIK